MNEFPLTINIEIASGKGEDDYLADSDYPQTVIGVFDGLGGRSAGYDGETGGRIASREAAKLSKEILWNQKGRLTKDIADELQQSICKYLKNQADTKMGVSRLRGSLANKRLCTTIAMASMPKQKANKEFEVNLAWMGDSRIYFLSPTKGLQQLTEDDLESSKDAFQMIREDPPMSQYITADMPEKWQIHWKSEKFQESGCILACTDGCFQYLPAPWDFEKLLLETLAESKTASEWKELLIEEYEKIRQDDVSLVLYPVGYTEFEDIKSNYQDRLANLRNYYNSSTDNHDHLIKLWESYRSDYEAMLETQRPAEESGKKPDGNSSVAGGDNGENLLNRFGNKLRNMVSEKENLREEDDADKRKQIHELIKQAEEMERRGYIQETVKLCQQVLKLEPDNIKANLRIGQFYYEEAQYEKAIRYCEQVARRENETYIEQYSWALIYLSWGHFYRKNYSQSVYYFDMLDAYNSKYHRYQLDKNDLEVWAISLVEVNEYDRAIEICDRLLQENESHVGACYLIGCIEHKREHLGLARHFLYRAISYQDRHQSKIQLNLVEEAQKKWQKVSREINRNRR